jgi:hypothetical protein
MYTAVTLQKEVSSFLEKGERTVTNAMDRLISCTSLFLAFCFAVRFVVAGGIVVIAGEGEKAKWTFFEVRGRRRSREDAETGGGVEDAVDPRDEIGSRSVEGSVEEATEKGKEKGEERTSTVDFAA